MSDELKKEEIDSNENETTKKDSRTRFERFFLLNDHTPASSFLIRFLAGMYLLYTSYKVLPPSSDLNTSEYVLVIIAAIVFIIAGLYLVVGYFGYMIRKIKKEGWRNPNLHHNDKEN